MLQGERGKEQTSDKPKFWGSICLTKLPSNLLKYLQKNLHEGKCKAFLPLYLIYCKNSIKTESKTSEQKEQCIFRNNENKWKMTPLLNTEKVNERKINNVKSIT